MGKATIIGIIALVLLGGVVLSYAMGAWGVVRKETDPAYVQAKYEWFKESAAVLDAKVASIETKQATIHSMEQDYNGTARKDWASDDRQQYNQWTAELAGMKASYNNLAADYNAQMAKWNWRFANAGSEPDCHEFDGGPCQNLPREYKPYITE